MYFMYIFALFPDQRKVLFIIFKAKSHSKCGRHLTYKKKGEVLYKWIKITRMFAVKFSSRALSVFWRLKVCQSIDKKLIVFSFI